MGCASRTVEQGQIPPGWQENPSAWSQRLPLAGFALLGFGVSSYLALYQWGVFDRVWEPFFGNGSQAVLHSRLARLLPVPDAALGALGYLTEFVADLIGGTARWRTQPWIVLFFGLVVSLLGLVSVLLMIAQPVFFGAYCTLCLVSAFISINLVGWAMHEVLATLQYLGREHARGCSLWHAFWGLDDEEE